MAKNYAVTVSSLGRPDVNVVVGTLTQATGLATTNLIKNRTVSITPVTEEMPCTHRTSAAAQATIEVDLFELVPREPLSVVGINRC